MDEEILLHGGIDGLMKEAALSGQVAASNSNAFNQNTGGAAQQHQPIVIHSVSSSDSKGGLATTLIKLSLGAGSCWAAYVLFSNFLPDQIKEMLPVTRKFFEGAVTSLANGILMVRDALSEQIAALGIKQDELANKQDETHESVLGIKDDIGDVRLHMDDISTAISRCENSLTDAAGRQTYMSRGVRLLVQCVGDLMRHNNPQVAEELDQFSRLAMGELMDDDKHSIAQRGHLECPGSPNLSEIGSTTSASIVDDHHHHHHHHMRSLSLPRPRRSQSAVTPEGPNSTSRVLRKNHSSNMMRGTPPPMFNMSSPGAMFNSSRMSSGGTVATVSTSMSSSNRSTSPENEHPQSEEAMNRSGHQVSLPDVENLVKNVWQQ